MMLLHNGDIIKIDLISIKSNTGENNFVAKIRTLWMFIIGASLLESYTCII